VWALVDEIIITTTHRESKDTIIPIGPQNRSRVVGERFTEAEWASIKECVDKLKNEEPYLPVLLEADLKGTREY